MSKQHVIQITIKQLEIYHFVLHHHDRTQWGNYKSRFTKIQEYFKDREFNVDKIGEFILSHSSYSTSTQAAYWNELRVCCEILKVDYMKSFKCPRVVSRKKNVLFSEEMSIFLQEAYSHSYRYGLVFEIALRHGLRINEFRDLLWDDLQGNELILRNTKSGSDQVVYVEKDLQDKIYKLKKYDHNHIFGGSNGLLSDHHINFFLKETLIRAGINKPMTFHDLRHSCASDLVYHDVNMYTIKEYLRHKNITTTEKYCHINPKALLNAGKKHTLGGNAWTLDDLQGAIGEFITRLSLTHFHPVYYEENGYKVIKIPTSS